MKSSLSVWKSRDGHTGRVSWCCKIPMSLPNGGEERYFSDPGGEDKARRFAASLLINRDNVDALFLNRSVADRMRILGAVELVGGDTDALYEAALGKAKLQAIREVVTVEKAAHDWIVDMQQRQLRERSWLNAKWFLSKCAHWNKRLVDSITPREVDEFVNSAPTPGMRINWIHLASTFFRFAYSRGWCSAPPTGHLRTPKHVHKPVTVLSPAECEKFLRTVEDLEPRMLPYIALRLFGGIRQQEAGSLTWYDIKDGHVNIGADRAKTRFRRLVPVNPTLQAWLQVRGPLPPDHRTQVHGLLKTLSTLSEVKLPQNVLRHSYCSYSIPIIGLAMTALHAGNSEAVLFQHYRSVVTKEEAEAFWALRPKPETLALSKARAAVRKAAAV